MADTKISELPVASAIASPDVAPIVQGGVTKQADVSLFGSSKASLILHSSGDVNDPTTLNAANAGIDVIDVNSSVVFRIWSNGNQDLFIGNPQPTVSLGGSNVLIGGFNLVGADPSVVNNVALGDRALRDLTTGGDNFGLGTGAGATIKAGTNNIFIGSTSFSSETGAVGLVLVGDSTFAYSGVTENAIAIGASCEVHTSNTAVIGNSSITDTYFGSISGASILHGKGDAVVFPDSDPHVAGAAYWVLGVLTRSAG